MCAIWPSGLRLLEYIYNILSLGPFIFGMPGILSPVLSPSTDSGVILGGIIAPYRAHRFGNGHIPSSTPFVEDFYSLRSVFYTSGHPHGGGSGCVNIGSTPYFHFYVPSFTALFPLGAVVMIIPPYILYFGFFWVILS